MYTYIYIRGNHSYFCIIMILLLLSVLHVLFINLIWLANTRWEMKTYGQIYHISVYEK